MDSGETPHQRLICKGIDSWNRWAITILGENGVRELPITEEEKDAFLSIKPLREGERKSFALDVGVENFNELNGKIILNDFPVQFKAYSLDTSLPRANYLFPKSVVFENIVCDLVAYLRFSVFCKDVTFSNVTFNSTCDLSNATFIGFSRFEQVEFNLHGYFNGSCFYSRLGMSGCQFKDMAHFIEANIKYGADFKDVIFGEDTKFDNTVFEGLVDFRRAIFNGKAIFNDSVFNDETDFCGAEFCGDPASFINVKFNSTTSFNRTSFEEPPRFHNTVLHQDTSFFRAKYGSINKINPFVSFIIDFCKVLIFIIRIPFITIQRLYMVLKNRIINMFAKKEPGVNPELLMKFFDFDIFHDRVRTEDENSRAWRTLKLAMNKIHNHELELIFYSYEMDEKRQEFIVDSNYSALLLLSCYNLLSGYGRSLLRPLVNIICIWGAFSGIYYFNWFRCQDTFVTSEFIHGVILSTANIIPFTPYSRTAITNTIGTVPVDIMFQITMITQNIASVVLWFLIGLALRNKFTLK